MYITPWSCFTAKNHHVAVPRVRNRVIYKPFSLLAWPCSASLPLQRIASVFSKFQTKDHGSWESDCADACAAVPLDILRNARCHGMHALRNFRGIMASVHSCSQNKFKSKVSIWSMPWSNPQAWRSTLKGRANPKVIDDLQNWFHIPSKWKTIVKVIPSYLFGI